MDTWFSMYTDEKGFSFFNQLSQINCCDVFTLKLKKFHALIQLVESKRIFYSSMFYPYLRSFQILTNFEKVKGLTKVIRGDSSYVLFCGYFDPNLYLFNLFVYLELNLEESSLFFTIFTSSNILFNLNCDYKYR